MCPLCVTESRGLCAIKCVCIAKIARESDFIQATCGKYLNCCREKVKLHFTLYNALHVIVALTPHLVFDAFIHTECVKDLTVINKFQRNFSGNGMI